MGNYSRLTARGKRLSDAAIVMFTIGVVMALICWGMGK